MRFIGSTLAALMVCAIGCAKGTGTLFVRVDSVGAVKDVDHFHVVVRNGGDTSTPIDLPLIDRPIAIPPARTFSLVFAKTRSGSTEIDLDAVAASGDVLASANAIGDLEPGEETDVNMVLVRGGDGGVDAEVSDMVALPKPVITSVSPPRGPTTGNRTMTIIGDDFFPGAIVTFAGVLATAQSVSKTQITALLPAKAGAFGLVPVAVENSDGQVATIAKAFSYYPGTLGFLSPKSYSVGGQPTAVVAGDFNGDGKQDLVVTNGNASGVSTLLGNGDGTFQSERRQAVTGAPGSLVIGDFNGDGKIDLAVAVSPMFGVSILLGVGNGMFQIGASYPSGSKGAFGIAVGDFNADGKLDLATANPYDNGAGVLSGNGDGTFNAAVPHATSSSPWSVAAADFDGNGKTDLAVANAGSDTVTVLFADSTGALSRQRSFATNSKPLGVATADLNVDGFPDLAIANLIAGDVSVLINDHLGGFEPQATYSTDTGARWVQIGDVNGDTVPDLVVANGGFALSPGGNTLTVLLGKGDGTFQPGVNLSTGNSPQGVALADFDGDGKLDVATANGGTNDVSVLINSSE